MKQVTIYRDKFGRYITKKQFENIEKRKAADKLTDLKITVKVFIVIVIIAATISIL